VSAEECAEAVTALGSKFRTGGYGELPAPLGFSALGMADLAQVMEEEQYRMLVAVREKSRVAAEEALGLCPGSLGIDFTHFTKKTGGGKHEAHADNCFAKAGDDWQPPRPVAACDEQLSHGKHPYPQRVAASILYLNDEFDGGEFFIADQRTGLPKTLVRGRPGRMAVFTSGAESLHGATPVRDQAGRQARRLALAIWYSFAAEAQAESVPPFAGPRRPAEL